MVVFPGMTFYHLPKAAGTFVRQVAIDLDLLDERTRLYTRYGGTHATPAEAPWRFRQKLQCVFVRHPVRWYRSVFAHRQMQKEAPDHSSYVFWWGAEGSRMLHSAFERCDGNFDRFAEIVTTEKPGYLSHIVARYTDGVRFVARSENATENLIRALKHAGTRFDERAIRSHSRVNTSRVFRVSPETEARIIRTEKAALAVWEACS